MDEQTNRRYELEDVNGQPLRFEGRELGFASSQRDDHPKPRWMEMRIYQTRGGQYILEIIGQTSIPGEAVKSRAKVLPTAEGLIDALHNTDETGTRYLTYTARDALYDAMEADDALEDAWQNRTREVA